MAKIEVPNDSDQAVIVEAEVAPPPTKAKAKTKVEAAPEGDPLEVVIIAANTVIYSKVRAVGSRLVLLDEDPFNVSQMRWVVPRKNEASQFSWTEKAPKKTWRRAMQDIATGDNIPKEPLV